MDQIETKRLLLRKLIASDAVRIEKLAGDYDVAKTTLNIPHPYPEGSASDFIESRHRAEEKKSIAAFAIVEKESQLFIGLINLNLSAPHSRGELAYWIGKDYWRKGYGTEAVEALIAYGFQVLHLHKIYAASFISNPGSWRVMEKAGLKYEGTLRQHVARLGEFHDLVYYGLLKEAYEDGLNREIALKD
ncbi:GNAT family N-acetyltransferase [Proteiniclasticum sp. C24MP]|uniref:GNAT family N-acetyltransferase n=1 Tax=Proteiniclasticum sp. C24MP TaxID=3374101 RepID=UPI003754833C